MEKFEFDEFMGLVTFMFEDNFPISLIKDMRIVLEKKVELNLTPKENLYVFDWYVNNSMKKN